MGTTAIVVSSPARHDLQWKVKEKKKKRRFWAGRSCNPSEWFGKYDFWYVCVPLLNWELQMLGQLAAICCKASISVAPCACINSRKQIIARSAMLDSKNEVCCLQGGVRGGLAASVRRRRSLAC